MVGQNKNNIFYTIYTKQLLWYGHVLWVKGKNEDCSKAEKTMETSDLWGHKLWRIGYRKQYML